MKIVSFFFVLFLIPMAWSQGKVEWKYSFQKDSKEVLMSAKISEGWHLYSQHINNEIGPVPTSFEFISNPNVSLVGSVLEPKAIQEYDENFEATLDFFKVAVVFKQKVKVNAATKLHGSVTYMVCNETMCLPPVEEKFIIELK